MVLVEPVTIDNVNSGTTRTLQFIIYTFIIRLIYNLRDSRSTADNDFQSSEMRGLDHGPPPTVLPVFVLRLNFAPVIVWMKR